MNLISRQRTQEMGWISNMILKQLFVVFAVSFFTFQAQAQDWDTNTTGQITYTGGKVGIGTTTPAAKLQVHSFGNEKGLRLYNDEDQAQFNFWPVASNGVKQLRLSEDTGGKTVMTFTENGNVGIGTTTPGDFKLAIHASNDYYSNIRLTNNANVSNGVQFGNVARLNNDAEIWNFENAFFRIGTNNTERFRVAADGKIGIGTSDPIVKLDIRSSLWVGSNSSNGLFISNNLDRYGVGNTNVLIETQNSTPLQIRASGDADLVLGSTSEIMRLNGEGNVGIGTSTPSHKLEVFGTIRAIEIRCEAPPWPDYVFEEDYELPSIESVESFIKSEGHLPEMPTAEEVAADGVALGEMNRLLLQKVEELTLYTIEQQKEIKQLKEGENVLIQQLLKRIEKIENSQK
ncbi:MAG: hypothetical protein AAGA66_03065 [Bacteroidota bacterium]